jgi:hypothetical protein
MNQYDLSTSSSSGDRDSYFGYKPKRSKPKLSKINPNAFFTPEVASVLEDLGLVDEVVEIVPFLFLLFWFG